MCRGCEAVEVKLETSCLGSSSSGSVSLGEAGVQRDFTCNAETLINCTSPPIEHWRNIERIHEKIHINVKTLQASSSTEKLSNRSFPTYSLTPKSPKEYSPKNASLVCPERPDHPMPALPLSLK